MDIKEIAESLLQQQEENEAVILEIFMTGSNVFELDRDTDKDYVVICDKFGQRRRRIITTIDGVKYDVLFLDKKATIAALDFNNKIYIDKGYDNKLYNYFYDEQFRRKIYGDSGIQWSVLEHKKEYMSFVRDKMTKSNYHVLKDPWVLGKFFVHYYMILKIFENNSVEMTEQMKNDIKLLYGRTEQAGPIIQWIISKLLESPEPYVVEGVPPVPQEDVGVVPPPVPITESSEQ